VYKIKKIKIIDNDYDIILDNLKKDGLEEKINK